ncbi:FAD-dependent oxidoreductase [Streptomyces sp. bgisy027]|uniref:FAD-dependent oxidoreductase n=1 Tax=unclassified Streptomyces TaxID=2593676 RepID=UPI003D7642BB
MLPQRHVAVVGAGPSGLYTAQTLARTYGMAVDVFERLPTPYGLLRYGVAPDHLKMKKLTAVLEKVLQLPGVCFFGNVEIGRDITGEELGARYDAVVYAVGASGHRALNVPGETLPGVHPATDFVSWYSGHPDADRFTGLDAVRSAVVVGAGNVALDVARVLARSPQELTMTDVPDRVLDELARSTVLDIHVVARRGPDEVKFTLKELTEMGALANADVRVHPDNRTAAATHPVSGEASCAAVLDGWRGREMSGKPRTVHFHFGLSLARIEGTSRVERAVFTPAGSPLGGGLETALPAQLLLGAVGSRGLPVAGLPFDEHRGVVPNIDGRVDRGDGATSREYVVGWIKRGPTGVIGTNRADALVTAATLAADLENDPALPRVAAQPMTTGELGTVVDWTGWSGIDAAEVARGALRSAARVKVDAWPDMLAAARDVTTGA